MSTNTHSSQQSADPGSQTQETRANSWLEPPYLVADLAGPEMSELCESSSEENNRNPQCQGPAQLSSPPAPQGLLFFFADITFNLHRCLEKPNIKERGWEGLLSPPRSFHLELVLNSSMSFTSSGRSSMNSATCKRHRNNGGSRKSPVPSAPHTQTPEHSNPSPWAPLPTPRQSPPTARAGTGAWASSSRRGTRGDPKDTLR